MTIDTNAKYLPSHEWARREGDLFVLGISDHAQESLGDVVYVELPEVGTTFRKEEVFGVVESVKAASDLFCPLTGEVVDVNQTLGKSPESVNRDPYGEGWMVKLKASNPSDWDALLSAEDYQRTAR